MISFESDEMKKTILLGGIGGDAHSVGLTILRRALQREYRVLYLGPQTDLEEFFRLSSVCNAVLISCMDGHARSYLRRFPEFMQQYPNPGVKWYIGGNPALGGEVGAENYFIEMGFDRVFCRFVDVRQTFEHLRGDLDGVAPARDRLNLWGTYRLGDSSGHRQLSDHRLDDEQFLARRAGVLASWSTGSDARDLEDNASFLAKQRSFTRAQAQVRRDLRRPLLQPRSGVALVDPQVQIFQALQQGGADVLSYQVDSMTRNNNYEAAQEGIRESLATGFSAINGFPVVNHGVGPLRKIARSIGVPLQTRHSTRAPELLAEVSYAGGVTGYEGGAICYNVPYYKDYSLSDSIYAWQYVDRLTGIYAERFGLVLDREFFGTLTATLIPPSLAIVTGILEALMAVTQGVRSVSIGYAEQGNRVQDVAAIHTIKSLVPKILQRAGHSDVQVNAIFHQYMAAFPESPDDANTLIRESAKTAAVAGATRVLTKTAVEAFRIPSMEDNLQALQCVRQGVNEAAYQDVDPAAVEREVALISREVHSMLDGVLTAGHGNITTGIVRAFDKGYLDIPFSSSRHNLGEVMTARDLTGAVRFLDAGELPLDAETKAFHRDVMSDRCHAESLTMNEDDHLLVERDVLRVARGEYVQWPLGHTSLAPANGT